MLVSGSWPRPSEAYVQPVIDAAAITQLGYQLARMIEMLGLTRQDLSTLANAGQLISVLNRLNAVAGQIQSLMGQVDARAFGWNGLASMNPCTGTALADWNYQAASWSRQASELMDDISALSSSTLDLLSELSALISSVVGTTSGLQTLVGMMAQLVTETQSFRSTALPYHQELQGARIIESVNQLASICLQRSLMTGWGTVTRFP